VRNTADPIAERIEHNTAHLARMADIGANLFCFAKRKLKIAILQIRPNNYARVTIVLFVAAIPGSGG
jgi:polyferredoxin